MHIKYKPIVAWIGLFTSASTLMCCAIPSALVLLGAGAMLASMVSSFPHIIWLSKHSMELFIFAGVFLLANGIVMYTSRNVPCTIGDNNAACSSSRNASKWIYFASIAIYLIALLAKFSYLVM